MNAPSLVELFEHYDSAFDQVCDEFKIENKPSWQIRWFHRFYQINPVPRFVAGVNDLVESGQHSKFTGFQELLFRQVFPQDTLLELTPFSNVYETFEKFYASRNESLPTWWFKTAKYYFSGIRDSVEEISRVNMYGKIYPQEIEKHKIQLELNLNRLSIKNPRPEYAILKVPLAPTKKQTLQIIEEYFDGEKFYEFPWDFVNNRQILKTKMPSKSVIEAYRLLEFKSFNPDESLVQLAKKSGLKKNAVLALSSSKPNLDSVNSARVGVFLHNKMALNTLQYCIKHYDQNDKHPDR
jgi:hypothetical protein